MNKKIKVLMGIPHPNTKGGPPTHLPILVDYFKENDDFEIQTFYIGSRSNQTEKGLIIKIFSTFRDIAQFLVKLIGLMPDIVHINSAFGSSTIIRDIPYAWLSKLFGAKTLLKIHGSHNEILYTENKTQKKQIKALFSKLDKIGVLSATEKDQFSKQFSIDTKLIICKNIVPERRNDSVWPTLKIETGKIYGLFVSRIDPKKGLIDLLLASQLIISKIPTFRLIVAGNGEAMDECKAKAKELGIELYIQWLGYVDSAYILDLYRKSQVFIFPTTYPEGMPMSLIDALKTGIPIVTTKVRFATSYLSDGENCLFIEKNNPQDIYEKVTHLLANSDLKEQMKQLNPSIVNQFSKEFVGKEFTEIYKNMI